MSGEDRLATLIRAQLDHETREIVPPPDLAGRVIAAGRTKRSRTRRWQVHLSIAAACAVVAGVVGVVPLVVDGLGSAIGKPAAGVTIVPIDPDESVRVGYVPPGLTEVTGGFVRDQLPVDSFPGSVSWRADYRARDLAAGPPVQSFSIKVLQSEASFEALRPKTDRKDWRSVEVATGRAEGGISLMRSGFVARIFLWEVRPKLIVRLFTAGLSDEEAVKILRGITITK